MLVVRYDAQGTAYSDFEAEKISREWVNAGGQQEHVVSSENMIFALRALVGDGILSPSGIVFEFQGQRIEVGRYGELIQYVPGFCDRQRTTLNHMMAAGLQRAKSEKGTDNSLRE